MKKIFTLMLLTMGAACAFTACSDDEPDKNGCTCTYTDLDDGETYTEFISGEEIKEIEEEYGFTINKCSDLNESDDDYVITCK